MPTFADTVRASLHGQRVLLLAEERRLARAGVENHGLEVAEARTLLSRLATAEGVTLQSDLDDAASTILFARARNGMVGSADVGAATELYRGRAGSAISPSQAEARVKSLVLSRDLSPRPEGWIWRTTGWFDRLPDEMMFDAATPPSGPSAPRSNPPGPTSAGMAWRADAPMPVGTVPAIGILDAWANAFNAHDVERVVSLYSPSALLLATASGTPYQGRTAIRPYFIGLLTKPQAMVEFSGPPLVSSGREPVTVGGLYVFSWLEPNGMRTVIPARYTYVLTRSTGSTTSEVEGAILQHHSSALPGGASSPV